MPRGKLSFILFGVCYAAPYYSFVASPYFESVPFRPFWEDCSSERIEADHVELQANPTLSFWIKQISLHLFSIQKQLCQRRVHTSDLRWALPGFNKQGNMDIGYPQTRIGLEKIA